VENLEAKAIKAHEAHELERIAQLFEMHAAKPNTGNLVSTRRK
jgi:hypothetical protein